MMSKMKVRLQPEPPIGARASDKSGDRAIRYDKGWSFSSNPDFRQYFDWQEMNDQFGPITIISLPAKQIKLFFKRNLKGVVEEVVCNGDEYTEVQFGILYTSPSQLTEVLVPWSQILEVHYR